MGDLSGNNIIRQIYRNNLQYNDQPKAFTSYLSKQFVYVLKIGNFSIQSAEFGLNFSIQFFCRAICTTMHTDIERRYPRYGCEDKLFALTHLLHPGQKGTILFKVGLFQPTIDQLITEEEGAP